LKSKNNDLVTQIFLAVVGVIFAGMIIYYVMNSIKVTSRLADTVLSSAEGTASEYAEIEITIYDGEEVRGAEVVNFIKKQLGDYNSSETAPIYVEVVTNTLDGRYCNIYTNSEHIESIKSFSNKKYIKPTAVFVGKVIRTKNRVIIGVEFTQI
jgi:hypothetical protein